MPWTVDDVEKHNKGLSAKAKRIWVAVANQSLSSGDDDATAIRKANGAAGRIKESLRTFHEAALRMDDSLSNLQSELQEQLSSEHLRSYDYEDEQGFPWVVDVFGDRDSGTVVYRVDDDFFSCSYKRTQDEDGDNDGFSFGEPSKVDRAYIPSQIQVEERFISHKSRKAMPKEDFAGKGTSFPIEKPGDVKAAASALGRAGAGNLSRDEIKKNIISIAKRKGWEKHLPKRWMNGDGGKKDEPLAAKESQLGGELVNLRESFLDATGRGRIKIVSPGSGSTGHYSESVLRKAASDKVFSKGTQMFLDHPSEDDMNRSGTGSVRNLAAKLVSDAEYEESGKDGPGLYANIEAFPDHREFLNSRSKDIAVSMSVSGVRSGKVIDGVPVVERLVRASSVDFVGRAGAGGKLCHLYESFREKHPGERPSAATEQRSNSSMEIDEKDLKLLRESAAKVPVLQAQMDRLEESNARLRADSILTECLSGSKLSARGQARVRQIVLANVPLKDGKLDEAALRESAKKAVDEEVAYLKESGITAGAVVTGNGAAAPTTEEQDAVLKESANLLENSLERISGVKKGGK